MTADHKSRNITPGKGEIIPFWFYLLTIFICMGGFVYFAVIQNGNPLGIGCVILMLVSFTLAQDKQLRGYAR